MDLYLLGRRPWRETQLIYHALPRLARQGVVICWPDRPYVCMGYSQDTAEADLAACEEAGLPVFRRAVGGGLVYLDGNQVFFHVVLAGRRPASPAVLYSRCLRPVCAALATFGVTPRLTPPADVTVAGRKISGNAGGELAGSHVVVGNVLLDFDFAAMARAVAAPDPAFRRHVRAAMEERLTTLRRELGAACPGRERVAAALAVAFEAAFGPLTPREVDAALREEMARAGEEMAGIDWPDSLPRRSRRREVKIAEGCYVRHAALPALGAVATWRDEAGVLAEVTLSRSSGSDGTAVDHDAADLAGLAALLRGAPARFDALRSRVGPWARRRGWPQEAAAQLAAALDVDGRGTDEQVVVS